MSQRPLSPQRPLSLQSWAKFVVSLHRDAIASGLKTEVVSAALADIKPDTDAQKRNQSQPEHTRTTGDYFNRLVSPARIDQGRRLLTRHADELTAIQSSFGVPAPVLVAIWGIESNYGQSQGTASVIQSLATLSHQDARRRAFWRHELFAALRIIQAGDIAPKLLVGSWAGAMGHTQFMPTTYLGHAVDFDGDGSRDIWHSISDALASAANYLRHSGWQQGINWGCEVRLEPTFNFAALDPSHPRSLVDWQSAGITVESSSSQLCPDQLCRLITPAGAAGPVFFITPNFDAILAYNRSTVYALSVGCLADRIAGGPPLAADWPIETPLSFTERTEIQQHLTDAGFDTNGIDGILGSGTLKAVRAYQIRHGLTADGHPDAELLRFMRTLPHDS